MKKFVLDNGVRFIYKYREGEITSFSIGLEAGANSEDGYNLGVAHALEHMVFKGTKTKSEDEINKDCDRLFGFNNAMTNFPYVIYYGTTTNDDFYEGLRFYGDIILNPSLKETGFKEEISVILEECREWKEDLDQLCEDEVFYNSFSKRRIKEIIIGTEESIKNITIDELKRFYNEFYISTNLVVSVVTSIPLEDVYDKIYEVFGKITKKVNKKLPLNITYEDNKKGTFEKEILGFKGSKIIFAYDISHLNIEEIEALKLFNMWFGEGVSSKLYDEIRSKNGLAYDVGSYIKNEKGIKEFIIYCSSSKENILKVSHLIKRVKRKSLEFSKIISHENFNLLKKRLKLKRALDLEKSIVLANRLTIYEIMYSDCSILEDELLEKIFVDIDLVEKTINKILKEDTIQILK